MLFLYFDSLQQQMEWINPPLKIAPDKSFAYFLQTYILSVI